MLRDIFSCVRQPEQIFPWRKEVGRKLHLVAGLALLIAEVEVDVGLDLLLLQLLLSLLQPLQRVRIPAPRMHAIICCESYE